MSTDPQVLKYLSAIAREVGEFRQDFISFRDKTEPRLDSIEGRLDKIEGRLTGVESRLTGVEGRLLGVEQEQRQTRRFMDRVHALLLTWSSDADELRERIEVLEEKKV